MTTVTVELDKPVISKQVADKIKRYPLATSKEKMQMLEKLFSWANNPDTDFDYSKEKAEVLNAVILGQWTVDDGLFVIRVPKQLGLAKELFVKLDEETGAVEFVERDQATLFSDESKNKIDVFYHVADNYIKSYQLNEEQPEEEALPTEEDVKKDVEQALEKEGVNEELTDEEKKAIDIVSKTMKENQKKDNDNGGFRRLVGRQRKGK